MAFLPIERLLPKTNYSVYRLVAMASKRATELADGAARLIENPSSSKVASIAMEEIAANKISLKEKKS